MRGLFYKSALDKMNILQHQQTKPLWLQIASFTSTILLILAVLTSSSLLLVYWSHSKQSGNIKLASDTPKSSTRKTLFSVQLLSHIDNSLGEDGTPVDVKGFWRRVSAHSPLGKVSLTSFAQSGPTAKAHPPSCNINQLRLSNLPHCPFPWQQTGHMVDH